MDREAAEALALETFRKHKGKVLLVRFLDGYRGDDSCVQEFNPPIRVRVVETSRNDILHWNDEFLDPYWDVAVLDGNRQELNGLRSTWVNGPSINVLTGQMEQAKDWKVAEDRGGFFQRLRECFGS